MNRDNEPNKQNGGQLPLKSTKPVPTSNDVCRDYVWGKCTKYAKCRLKHECDIETMKSIIKFCHDFQNPIGCSRPNCTFLHTSSGEQKLFLEAGQIPQELAKRHALIDNIVKMSRKTEDNNYVSKPPPPPLESQPPPPPPMGTAVYHGPRWFPLPPPPPPPPPPKEVEPAPSSTYTCPPNPAPVYIPQQPLLQLPLIDTSRPPPPIPQNFDFIKLGAVKRTQHDICEAGPSKARKSPKRESSTCENCKQWDYRNLLLDSSLKEKLAEKARAVLKFEEVRTECNNLFELLLKNFKGTPQFNSPLSSFAARSPPREYHNDFLRAVIANYISGITKSPSKNQFLRILTDLLKDSEESVTPTKNCDRDLDFLIGSEFDSNLAHIISGLSANASVSSTPSFPSTSALAPPAAPPPLPSNTYQPYRPTESQMPYPFTFVGNLSNGVGASSVPKTTTNSTPSVPMPSNAMPLPYSGPNNYPYGIMGRLPPYQ